MAVETAPEHYKYAVIPHILVEGADQAVRFYRDAFGARELFRLDADGGGILHAEISIEGSVLMLGDGEGQVPTDRSVLLHVYIPDVDGFTERAVGAGAELLTPPTNMPYGARQSMLRDPFGYTWVFLTPLAD